MSEHRISIDKIRGITYKEKPAKGEVEGRESSRGKPKRRGKCRFLLDLFLSPPSGFPSRIKPTPLTLTYKKAEPMQPPSFPLYMSINYPLLLALISARSSEFIPVYRIMFSSERLSASMFKTVLRFSSANSSR